MHVHLMTLRSSPSLGAFNREPLDEFNATASCTACASITSNTKESCRVLRSVGQGHTLQTHNRFENQVHNPPKNANTVLLLIAHTKNLGIRRQS